MSKTIQGFSRLSKTEKIDWISDQYLSENPNAKAILKQYWNGDDKLQQLHDEFIENTISNYYLPLGVAPNFLINDRPYAIPMAIEESSVVAAASKAAKFWMTRGGFKTEILGTVKVGHVHFTYDGEPDELILFFEEIKSKLIKEAKPITKKMEDRGGGILDIVLKNKTKHLNNYYQLQCTFETLDAMGANFINSCLEQFAETFQREFESHEIARDYDGRLQIIMSILSNYVPECIAVASVSCPIEELADGPGFDAQLFATKFEQAVKIAQIEPYRAVTHNKGIMNGVDAVVIATGNDFRAVEAGIHAYAARKGSYSSLTKVELENGNFTFSIKLPLALGTVGGLTNIHPLVKLNLELLGNPSAEELMQIVAVAGLAQNFGAIKSLTTTGIQKGHMKMHLMNILNQMSANDDEKSQAINHFKTHKVTHSAVEHYVESIRK
ncbi:hydroxymethylglutaryl-CoA reductase, degradative [Flavimarina sp. Hel_I_48]|uniref:hydroxymethylglutaryl-CoA reductase, degradative n=1 Tax=Flavimarina sp. Hel_I_48 TaxID=1392488 RepID=UPI0004DF2033|nr:hydroxymethylglutaryl-CoA reductase, degradative [Flavimarina sp. Hel_I_48]